ncbi:hypothetical protein [Pseudaminobacter sp. NGMCC 1.201702]|uniref:hypothetical protein n=1 Tax=Pseudaminobacter sp. NGMCC 1.201702 TaxID=3391825 RepID=UPI0039EE25BC
MSRPAAPQLAAGGACKGQPMTPKGYKLKLTSIADKLFSALRTLSHLPAHGMTDTLVVPPPRDRRIFVMLFSGAKKPG